MPVKFAVWLIVSVGLAAAAQQATTTDDERGKALVQTKCTQCHGLDEIQAENTNRAGWLEVVDAMRTRGAELTNDEATVVVNYLTRTYSQDTSAETKKLVESTCGGCHGMEVVTSAQKSKDEWVGVVREMIGYGASLKEEQIGTVADYLGKNYGPKK